MLRLIQGLPDGVLGVDAVGKVEADDYRDVLVPAIERVLARHSKARLLYVLGREFDGFSGAAAWQDAKVGMKHFTDFERVAVVTDVDWIGGMVKAFGFMLPGDVETFGVDELEDATAWIVEPRSRGKLEFKLDEERGVLILTPRDELEIGDFDRVSAAIDPFIESSGGLRGLLVVADEFPGWDNFAALTSHFRFVREHQAKVRRVALVTSSRFLAVVPRLARHFVAAEVRHFDTTDYEKALAWVSS